MHSYYVVICTDQMVVVKFSLKGKIVVDIDIDNHDPSQKSRAAWEELLIGGRFISEHWSH